MSDPRRRPSYPSPAQHPSPTTQYAAPAQLLGPDGTVRALRPAAAPSQLLLVMQGPEEAISFASWGMAILGRGDECDFRLADPRISRKHVMFFPFDSTWIVCDLNSRAGTYINGTAQKGPIHLIDGDVLRVGSTQLRVAIAQRRAALGYAQTG